MMTRDELIKALKDAPPGHSDSEVMIPFDGKLFHINEVYARSGNTQLVLCWYEDMR